MANKILRDSQKLGDMRSYPDVVVSPLTMNSKHFLVLDVNLAVIWRRAVYVILSVEIFLEGCGHAPLSAAFRSVGQ